MTYMTDLPTLTVWAVNSHPHDLASKSHDESENLEIAGQFQQKSLTNIQAFLTAAAPILSLTDFQAEERLLAV